MIDISGAFNSDRFEDSLRNCSSPGEIVSACQSAVCAIEDDCSQRRKKLFAVQDELDEMKSFLKKLADAIESEGYSCLADGVGVGAGQIAPAIDSSLAVFDDARNHAVYASEEAEDCLSAVIRHRNQHIDDVWEARRTVLRKLDSHNEG